MYLRNAQRNDILVSYITGLGPVGEPVCCSVSYVKKDLGWDKQSYYTTLNRLIRSRRVQRFAQGMYIVLERLEAA